MFSVPIETQIFSSFLFSVVIRSQKMAFATRHLLSRKSSWGNRRLSLVGLLPISHLTILKTVHFWGFQSLKNKRNRLLEQEVLSRRWRHQEESTEHEKGKSILRNDSLVNAMDTTCSHLPQHLSTCCLLSL